MVSESEKLFNILLNVMKNCGISKVDTIIKMDPTCREVLTMWVSLDSSFEKMKASSYEEYIEPECYKIRVTSIWDDEIEIFNYERQKVLENYLDDTGKWLRPQCVKVGSRYVKLGLTDVLKYILERGTFLASRPAHFRCTCKELGYVDEDDNYLCEEDIKRCPHCIAIEIEECDRQLLASAI